MHKNRNLNLLLVGCLYLVVFSRIGYGYVLPSAVPGTYTSILNNKTTQVMVFAYQGKDNITIIDFPTLAEQGQMFNRIIALLELGNVNSKKVLNDEELSKFIASIGKTRETLAYGNDFEVAKLVIFFNYARDSNIQLNAEEQALRQHLMNRRLIQLSNKFYRHTGPPGAVVLSIPQITAETQVFSVTDLARSTILSHEMSHGEYSTNPAYRKFCKSFWNSVMTETQRAAFRKFLGANDYNTNDEDLMINETQAYLMYTPDPRAFSPEKVKLSVQVIGALRKKFLQGFPGARPPTTS
jgi:hypothetical protein